MWFDPPVLSITPSLPIVDLNICVVEPNCALCGDVMHRRTRRTGQENVKQGETKNEKIYEGVGACRL
jgi:hypothetical protein